MTEATRKIWLLSKEARDDRKMSPATRIAWMRESANSAGYGVDAVCCLPGDPSFNHFLSKWRPGEPVILDPYVPGKALVRLLGSRIPFDADFYCLSLPETAEQFPEQSLRWQQRERIRHALKYAWIAKVARRLYFSTHQQVLSFTGILATGPDRTAPGLASRLATRCVELPLGVRFIETAIEDPPNPYPLELHGRSIALWGGGIWPWFDMETLLQAFAKLPDRDNGPALFFLSSTNHRSDPRADEPISKTRKRAKELGLLGRNVFFNQLSVSSDSLAPWLFHATMGVMANPASWEAMVSWRTRYLDLLAHGVPLVVAGSDPLAERMAENSGAVICPAGDAVSLASKIQQVGNDPELRLKLSESVKVTASILTEKSMGRLWIQSLRNDPWEQRAYAHPPWLDIFRFRLGLG
jgi:glycosyltransferase involved in cell wall biosynthesis